MAGQPPPSEMGSYLDRGPGGEWASSLPDVAKANVACLRLASAARRSNTCKFKCQQLAETADAAAAGLQTVREKPAGERHLFRRTGLDGAPLEVGSKWAGQAARLQGSPVHLQMPT